MNWKYKAAVQSMLSYLPCGGRLHYLLQRYVTRSLPLSQTKCVEMVLLAREHLDAIQRCYAKQVMPDAQFYEFGVGWTMAIPLALWCLGIQHQIVIDIRRLARPELVNDTIVKLQQCGPDLGLERKPDLQIDDGASLSALLEKHYGICYRAPYDARCTGLETQSIDFITSTDTLEHIPLEDLRQILKECHRVLHDDGAMSFRIDYQDHYSYFDKNITAYNFLRYSERTWAMFNPKLHYQNRMRHRDYIELFRNAGFAIVEERPLEARKVDLENLRQLPVDERFRAYSILDLSIRGSSFVLCKEL